MRAMKVGTVRCRKPGYPHRGGWGARSCSGNLPKIWWHPLVAFPFVAVRCRVLLFFRPLPGPFASRLRVVLSLSQSLCCCCHCAPVVAYFVRPLVCGSRGGAQGWACTTGRPPRGDEGPFMPAGSGSRPSSASSGAVEAECQQEAEATHPATARGRWKRNASRKRKPPIQRQLGGSGSRMPA